MKFQKELYPYQQEILSVFQNEKEKGEKKIHIVAPPGSGKTIIGCEILTRIGKPVLILVPNLTLEQQWQDKLEKLFFESGETRETMISTSIDEVKYINILTYQSIAGTDEVSQEMEDQILEIWFQSEKNEFSSKSLFLNFINELKINAPEEYRDTYAKQKKKLKNSGESSITKGMMREKIHSYTKKLKEYGVELMIVDEAHHLTSWWSHVLFEIWSNLDEPYIVGLTATPPFDNVDYFELDESYTKLLGNVDYIVPTPAIVRSGRLAPYSDLLYIVSPDTTLSETLKQKEVLLHDFLEIHKGSISLFLHTFLSENYEKLKIKSGDLCDKWMRFVYRYKSEDIDMGSYIHGGISDSISLEDIAKSVGKWAYDDYKKKRSAKLLDEVKSLFFDLGYIWRGANLYRFETPLEKGLIYASSKIEGVKEILKKEEENLHGELRVAIITDFLSEETGWLNCHSIFDEVVRYFPHLTPYIVSGQGIWKMENGVKTLTENESILTVTEKLTRGEIQIVIGTRGILGEGWDCPKINTLIDLTGVSAYMSVNQVHGRAIRLDPSNEEKVANIYDIVCIGEGYQGLRDFERLKKKHTQFYGVDDAGLVIKGLDHIYPHLERNIRNIERINTYTLKKSSLRSMVKDLWDIGGDFKNQEIFSLSINILRPDTVIPLTKNASLLKILLLKKGEIKHINFLEFGKSQYHSYIRNWIGEILNTSLVILKQFEDFPPDFKYELKWTEAGNVTIIGKSSDILISKRFIDIIEPIFSNTTNQKYIFDVSHFSEIPVKIDDHIEAIERKTKKIYSLNDGIFFLLLTIFPIPAGIYLGALIGSEVAALYSIIGLISVTFGLKNVPSLIRSWTIAEKTTRERLNGLKYRIAEKKISINECLDFALPEILTSNVEKRKVFQDTLRIYGDIRPTEKSDIGKPPFLSAKIEKLWI